MSTEFPRKLLGVSTVSETGQTTIVKQARERLGLEGDNSFVKPGTRIKYEETAEGLIVISKVY
jgi:bifunctional DNA-binding transcriptional regulator/antitoxin component of YhaV-PrlF toxin-antitoxin module